MKKLFKFYVLAVLLGAPDLLVAAPIHDAVRANNFEEVKKLINKRKNDVNAIDEPDGRAPLHYAAQFGYTKIVDLLIGKGARIDVKDVLGMTPLHYAAYYGHTATAGLLIEKGAVVNAESGGLRFVGLTPLHCAANNGHTSTAELLVDRGADIKATDINGQTPLHNAAVSGSAEIVELLINNGAKVNVQASRGPVSGWTPLHYAVFGKASSPHDVNWDRVEKVVRLLLKYGASMYVKNAAGQVPLDLAFVKANRLNMPTYRLKMVKVFEEFKKYIRMFWGAVCRSNYDIARLALTRGVNPNVIATEEMISKRQDTPTEVVECVRGAAMRGDTPMHIAVEKGDARMVALLAGFDGRFDIENKFGDIASHLAGPAMRSTIPEIARPMDIVIQEKRGYRVLRGRGEKRKEAPVGVDPKKFPKIELE